MPGNDFINGHFGWQSVRKGHEQIRSNGVIKERCDWQFLGMQHFDETASIVVQLARLCRASGHQEKYYCRHASHGNALSKVRGQDRAASAILNCYPFQIQVNVTYPFTNSLLPRYSIPSAAVRLTILVVSDGQGYLRDVSPRFAQVSCCDYGEGESFERRTVQGRLVRRIGCSNTIYRDINRHYRLRRRSSTRTYRVHLGDAKRRRSRCTGSSRL